MLENSAGDVVPPVDVLERVADETADERGRGRAKVPRREHEAAAGSMMAAPNCRANDDSAQTADDSARRDADHFVRRVLDRLRRVLQPVADRRTDAERLKTRTSAP